jgi:hypothetical protein
LRAIPAFRSEFGLRAFLVEPGSPRKIYQAFSHGFYRSAHPNVRQSGSSSIASQYTATVGGHQVSSSVDVDLCNQDIGVL